MTKLFCDSSFSPARREGIAAFVRLDGDALTEPSIDDVNLSFFAETTNTRLELQGVLWGLETLPNATSVEVYTDCANITQLLERQARLVASKFTNRSGRQLANADLYERFFAQCERLEVDIHLLKGHVPASKRGPEAKIFALVDRAARRSLRMHITGLT